MKFKLFKATLVGLILSISSLAHSALIEWEYDINQYASKFASSFGINDRFGFGFDENTDFDNIAISDLQMFYYVVDGTRYDYFNPSEGSSNSTTSRFTYVDNSLIWNDSTYGPAEGSDPNSGWTWYNQNASTGTARIVSGENTTYSFQHGSVSRTASMHWLHIPNRNDQYTAVRTNYVPNEVPEPSTLAIFALGLIGLASRRFKKQS